MATAVQVQYRRGTATQIESFTGAQGELVVDTTNNRVVVQDGVTAGGFPAARLTDLPVISRTPVSDAAYTALTSDRTIAYTTLTAARIVSLPAAASFPVGVRLAILDESGSASGAKTISVAASGTDTIDGAASAAVTSSYGYIAVESNGTNKWTVVDQAASNLGAVGIGTAADPTNPLSVTANNALLNALATGAGGTGDFRIKLNKASAANTASTQYQDGFTTHAEVGLCGDDNFHFKVSPDGSIWYDALDIAASGGAVTLGASPAAGDASSRAVTTAWHGQNLPGGYVNKFRNGTMDVWQRGTASMTVTTAGAYTADGWIVVPSGASCGAQAAAGRLLTVNSLQIYGGSGVTDIIVKQRIESYLAASLTSQTVTVQAQIYNNTGAALTPALTVKHAGSADTWSSPVTDISAVSLQSCANGTWTLISYTFAASSACAKGLEVSFDFGNNFSSSSKSVQIAECDLRVTPGVSTGLNSTPPPSELRPLNIEMPFDQRYVRSSYPNGVAPGTSGYGTVQVPGIAAVGNGYSYYTERFGSPMRATPTVSVYSYNGAASQLTLSTTDQGTNSADSYTVSTGGFGIANFSGNTISFSGVGQGLFNFFASAEL